MLELGPAEVTERPDVAVAATTADGGRVKTHRVFARADQDRFRGLRQVNLSARWRITRTRADASPRIDIPKREEMETGGRPVADREPHHFNGRTDPIAAAVHLGAVA
ncbi:hypothetical protein BJS_02223 [Bradyrhizobium japonicum SEMIA 5079]|nr:hypothetical protein BJS_02223 [Bradyrhizobium japonicum SEMIA 5079]